VFCADPPFSLTDPPLGVLIPAFGVPPLGVLAVGLGGVAPSDGTVFSSTGGRLGSFVLSSDDGCSSPGDRGPPMEEAKLFDLPLRLRSALRDSLLSRSFLSSSL